MKENYIKLINACLPNNLITALKEKSGLKKEDVEHICLEVVARVFGDGSDLKKNNIMIRLNNVVGGQELKSILTRLNDKYGISANNASVVLTQLLPLLFKRITSLNDSYFDEEHPVKVLEEEKIEPIVQPKQEEIIKPIKEEKQEESVDDVFKNIEKKAEAQYASKKIEKKEKKPLFKKRKKLEKGEIEGTIDNKELSIIEKICIIAVLIALLALIGTIAYLFIKQQI